MVQAIRGATDEVFTTMLNLTVTPGEEFVEKEEAVPSSGVVSLIGLAGRLGGIGKPGVFGELAPPRSPRRC